MPSFVSNSDTNTTFVLNNNEAGIIGPNGFATATSPVGVITANTDPGTRADLVIHGIVHHMDTGPGVRTLDGDFNLRIGDTGAVSSAKGSGVLIVSDGRVWIDNAGEIFSFLPSAVRSTTQSETRTAQIDLVNTGSISSLGVAVLLASGTEPQRIVNHGTIHGGEQGMELVVTPSNSGFARNVVIENTGMISGGAFGAMRISPGTGFADISNTGEVVGSMQFLGQATVRNTGLIDGDVFFADTDDRFLGLGGVVTGRVDGGAGRDLYRVDQPGLQIVESTKFSDIDEVRALIDWSLTPGVEVLFFEGAADLSGYGSNLADRITGNVGENLLAGFGGDDSLFGGEGNDTLLGGFGADLLSGEGGDDSLVGGSSDDTILGSTGADTILGGQGTDTLDYSGLNSGMSLDGDTVTILGDVQSFTGIEVIVGTVAADTMMGDGSAQEFRGAGGVDTIMAGSGNDTVEGGTNGDQLFGGFGFDTLSYASSAGAVNVNLLAGTASGGDSTGDTFDSFEHLTGSGNGDTLAGGEFSNILTGLGGADVIGGRNGNDTILGGDGDDRLFGENGNDRFEGGDGNDTMIGGTGEDVFLFRPTHDADTIRFWDGSEDFIRFVGFGFGYANAAAAYADFAQVGANAVWSNGGDSITLEGVTLNVGITVSDIIV